MSISSTARLAIARDSGSPTRGNLGRGNPSESGDAAKMRDVLAAMVPTELIAPYTLAIAIWAGMVDDPTPAVPHPTQYLIGRWITFGALVALSLVSVFVAYKTRKQAKVKARRFPFLELLGTLVAAVAWGLSTPESPVLAALDGKMKAAIPVLLAAAGAAFLGVMSPLLKKPASS